MAIEATKSNIDSFVLTNSSIDADINKIDLINRYLDMNNDPYTIFMNAIKSPNTREKYDRRLKIFLDFIKIPGDDMKDRCIRLSEMGKNNNQRTISCIIAYIMYQKERLEKKEITGGTLFNYLKAIKLFCEMTDISIPWKKITRGISRGRRYAEDRAPTREEIRKICEYPDRRIRSIVYMMCSGGLRIGAWDYLKWGNIQPLLKDGKVVAAKVVVYAGEEEEHFTFITPEAYTYVKEWIEYRIEIGETVTKNSWVMRDLWDTSAAIGRGLITKPKKLKSTGIKRLIERALWAQGVRKKLEDGKKRHEFQADHGYRKFFKTHCEIAGMKPINIEKLMGHSTGISDSYYRATENEMLSDYLIAVDSLTINEENRLKHQINELSERNDVNQYIITSKLMEKEKEIKKLEEKSKENDDAVSYLSDQIVQLMKEVRALKETT
ncbi:MAG: tyrosine-type recombinase/integrase [Candidatus Nitrosocosmicus sp.]|nr:tyrosine-type recombinase/integrase [Candidatus Nitrosocosmicus sp.]MDN5866212.1 tyrosine-type recombinase/integrase [Candidatus Nitrosocosmicus sp.]